QQNHPSEMMDNDGYNEFPHYGLNGSVPHLRGVVWGLNMKSRWSETQKLRRDTSPSTFSNLPFSQLIGLKGGNASDTVNLFLKRRSGKATQ
ncbi:MAG TPA: hypothetical protein VLK33_17515, partial [Terriglobales bacterium]|nr:hypothetical protein [Terriglobales bacterium]